MTMALYLVRHAKAASRREWTSDDRDRPLTESGTMQADAHWLDAFVRETLRSRRTAFRRRIRSHR